MRSVILARTPGSHSIAILVPASDRSPMSFVMSRWPTAPTRCHVAPRSRRLRSSRSCMEHSTNWPRSMLSHFAIGPGAMCRSVSGPDRRRTMSAVSRKPHVLHARSRRIFAADSLSAETTGLEKTT